MASQVAPQDGAGDKPHVNGRGGQSESPKQPPPESNIQQAETNGDAVAHSAKLPQDGRQSNGAPKSRKPPSFPNPLRTLTMKTKGPPGGFDNTPLPDAPQGYTVRFIFHHAVNLPPADIHNASSDPFLSATLKAANPKRHKSDPDLVHRTPTLRRTTEPKWDDQWIVSNVPPSGFTLKCRMYDEDFPDGDDRLGNVTIRVPSLYDDWKGIPPPGREYLAKKRMISKRAFIFKGVSSVISMNFDMTPRLCISMVILGKSNPPYAQMCTLGPTTWIKHFSPMIGRLTGTKVNADNGSTRASSSPNPGQENHGEKKTQKYDFQANEMQLQGPVPPRLYHRYVEFKPIIGSMFTAKGIRGKILNAALHKQHSRVYNFNSSTQYGEFEPCSEEASLQFLRMAHFDDGGRIFTYVVTLDGLLRFTETGHEFGIDLLSKHTMHSDVQTYIACSGEFLIRRLKHASGSDEAQPHQETHPATRLSGGPPDEAPPENPAHYQLIIDNDSGTYRPDKRLLPDFKEFLEYNFPGLGIVAMDCGDEKLIKMKEKQFTIKKKEGRILNTVMNVSLSSLSSAESALDDRDATWQSGMKSKREAAYAAVEDPTLFKDAVRRIVPGMEYRQKQSPQQGESSTIAAQNVAAQDATARIGS